MPRTIPSPGRTQPAELAPNRKRWTRQDCAFLVESGLLNERYELIDGDVISKMGQKPTHAYVVKALFSCMIRLFGEEFVRCQMPIEVAEVDPEINQPEPDAAVTSQSYQKYTDRHPGPDDVLLVVEVADSTLGYDLRNKASLYARSGFREYWVIDVVGRRVIAHRRPEATGYRSVVEFLETETIAPSALPAVGALVGDLLPPIQA